jgi:hypothetical protein
LDCRPCDIGYYQDETGKMSCKSCGNGQTTQHTESTSKVDCLSKYNGKTTQHTESTSEVDCLSKYNGKTTQHTESTSEVDCLSKYNGKTTQNYIVNTLILAISINTTWSEIIDWLNIWHAISNL